MSREQNIKLMSNKRQTLDPLQGVIQSGDLTVLTTILSLGLALMGH